MDKLYAIVKTQEESAHMHTYKRMHMQTYTHMHTHSTHTNIPIQDLHQVGWTCHRCLCRQIHFPYQAVAQVALVLEVGVAKGALEVVVRCLHDQRAYLVLSQ